MVVINLAVEDQGSVITFYFWHKMTPHFRGQSSGVGMSTELLRLIMSERYIYEQVFSNYNEAPHNCKTHI